MPLFKFKTPIWFILGVQSIQTDYRNAESVKIPLLDNPVVYDRVSPNPDTNTAFYLDAEPDPAFGIKTDPDSDLAWYFNPDPGNKDSGEKKTKISGGKMNKNPDPGARFRIQSYPDPNCWSNLNFFFNLAQVEVLP